ncbi:MAG TPA: sialidase family protein [Anaerolineales bacterium]|nr:sialidase family protein [Anaerolineales bacterium]
MIGHRRGGSLRWSGAGSLVVGLALVAAVLPNGRAPAQVATAWSEPERIPEYHNLLTAPFLVADQNRWVHAFDQELHGTQTFVIAYRRWSLDQGWSTPVDILLPEFLGLAPSLSGVYLDPTGTLHLIYFGGAAEGGSHFYTRASAAEADKASAWSVPVPIGTEASTVVAAAIQGDGQGRLVVVYGGERFGRGLYEVHSLDEGATWSKPTALSLARREALYVASVWAEFDGDGRLHIVWHETDAEGDQDDIRYLRLSADFAHPEPETVLAVQDYAQESLGWPSLLTKDEDVLVIYQDAYPPTRWIRRSSDGGNTWSPPIRPFPHRGGYGYAALTQDSRGTIHVVLGNRLQDPEIHGMWYSRLVGDTWLPLEPIISGPATDTFDPCCPRAVVVQGNVLLATWAHNVTQDFLTGAWYAYTVLDAPEVPVQVVATPTGATDPSTPTPEIVSATPVPTVQRAYGDPSPRANPASPILWGVISVIGVGALAAYGRKIAARPPRDAGRKGEVK